MYSLSQNVTLTSMKAIKANEVLHALFMLNCMAMHFGSLC